MTKLLEHPFQQWQRQQQQPQQQPCSVGACQSVERRVQHASAVSKAYTGPTVPVRLRFAALHAAWGKVRRGKRPSSNHLAFASRWLDALQTLHQQLRAGTGCRAALFLLWCATGWWCS